MSSPKLAYLYLPAIALTLALIGISMKLYYGEPIPISIYFFVPVMIVLLYIGVRKKVWKH